MACQRRSGLAILRQPPKARGLHWKTFTTALDAVALSEMEEERAIAGARAAFTRGQELVNNQFAQNDTV